MSVVVVTPPASEPITLADAKAHLRVTHDIEDAQITACIIAARAYVENWCDRALMLQTRRLTLDAFAQEICLTGGRVKAISAMKYTAPDGAEQSLDASAWQADLDAQPARLRPAQGRSWPATASQMAAVRVEYQVGYDDAASVPAPIRAALLLLIGDLYENRQAQQAEPLVENRAVESLLYPYRRLVL